MALKGQATRQVVNVEHATQQAEEGLPHTDCNSVRPPLFWQPTAWRTKARAIRERPAFALIVDNHGGADADAPRSTPRLGHPRL